MHIFFNRNQSYGIDMEVDYPSTLDFEDTVDVDKILFHHNFKAKCWLNNTECMGEK